MDKSQAPAFVKVYDFVGGCLRLHSGTPVNAVAVESFVEGKVGSGEQNKYQHAAFWVLEGLLFDYELDPAVTPTLHYYLANRGGKSLEERWEFYGNTLDHEECLHVTNAYVKTRRHVMETEAEDSVEEKKSA